MLLLYNLMVLLTALVGLPFILVSLAQPKRKATFRHRLGLGTVKLSKPLANARHLRPIWVHALSVGEVASAEPLVDRLRVRFPNDRLVFSASTRTGMETAMRLFKDKVDDLLYFPYDLVFSVRRAIDCVQPRLVVIVETDIWPNFLTRLRNRRIPVLLVNARLSDDSFRGYRLLGGFSLRVLDSFCGIGAQTVADAKRFVRLGLASHKVTVTGNLKFDQQDDDASATEGGRLRCGLGIDPECSVLLLGSTHAGEETAGLRVFLALRAHVKNLMLLVAPRDPGRAQTIANQFRSEGLAVRLLSRLDPEPINIRCDAMVVNVIGILRRLYAAADIVFIGGSLVPEGGHNPLEPAACGKPILFGPDMSDFRQIAEQLIGCGGAVRIRDEAEMHAIVSGLLAERRRLRQIGRNALSVFQANKGAVDKTVDMIAQHLAAEPADHAPMS